MFSKRLANQRRTVHSRPPRRSIRSPKQFRIQHHLDGFHTVEDIPQSSQQSSDGWRGQPARSFERPIEGEHSLRRGLHLRRNRVVQNDHVLDAAAVPRVGDVEVPARIFDDGGIAELARAGFEVEPSLPSLSAIARNGDA